MSSDLHALSEIIMVAHMSETLENISLMVLVDKARNPGIRPPFEQ